MNWKHLVTLVLVILIGLLPGPARACMTQPTFVDGLVDATTKHLTGGKDLPVSQKPYVRAVSLFEPYYMTSWVQGKTMGEYLFRMSGSKLILVGGGAAKYSAEDLVRLFHVPQTTASALVDRFIRLRTPATQPLSPP